MNKRSSRIVFVCILLTASCLIADNHDDESVHRAFKEYKEKEALAIKHGYVRLGIDLTGIKKDIIVALKKKKYMELDRWLVWRCDELKKSMKYNNFSIFYISSNAFGSEGHVDMAVVVDKKILFLEKETEFISFINKNVKFHKSNEITLLNMMTVFNELSRYRLVTERNTDLLELDGNLELDFKMKQVKDKGLVIESTGQTAILMNGTMIFERRQYSYKDRVFSTKQLYKRSERRKVQP